MFINRKKLSIFLCQEHILSCPRLGKIMVQATMSVYKDTIDSFLPTPSKSHYIFNLRDFARVIRGVLLAPHTHMQVREGGKNREIDRVCSRNSPLCKFLVALFQDGDKLIRLWIHEVYRVFYDRLIDSEDRDTFFMIVKENTSNFFKMNLEKVNHSKIPLAKLETIFFISQIINKWCKKCTTDLKPQRLCLIVNLSGLFLAPEPPQPRRQGRRWKHP